MSLAKRVSGFGWLLLFRYLPASVFEYGSAPNARLAMACLQQMSAVGVTRSGRLASEQTCLSSVMKRSMMDVNSCRFLLLLVCFDAWYLAVMVDCCWLRSRMTKGMAPPGTPAAQSCCLSVSGMWWSFLFGFFDQIFSMVFCRFWYSCGFGMLFGAMFFSVWCADPPASEPSVVSMLWMGYLRASCMAWREFSWWVEWMWSVRGVFFGESIFRRAGMRVDMRCAVSWPDMSLMAMAVYPSLSSAWV